MNRSSPDAQARVGVIDLGSNTVLLLVLQADGRVVLDRSEITRLGRGVFTTNSLDPERVRRTREVAGAFIREARACRAAPVVAVGTEALRQASDGVDFLRDLVHQGGADAAYLLTGEEEAGFAIEASRRSQAEAGLGASGDRSGPLVVVDVGGGSTEIAWTLESGEARGTSLPVGSVRLTEACVHADPPLPAELAAVRETLAPHKAVLLAIARELGPRVRVVAVAGTATTLAALELELARYDPERVEGLELARERVGAWARRLAALAIAERRALPGMEPGRADVLPAGLVLLDEILGALGAERFRVSGRGVRHGVAWRLLEDPRATLGRAAIR